MGVGRRCSGGGGVWREVGVEGVEGVGGGEAGGEGLEFEHGLKGALEVGEGALEAVVAEPAAEDGGGWPGLGGWAGGVEAEGAEEG